jgi:hypothetical protein
MFEETMSDIQCQILRQYFEKTKDFGSKQIKSLLVDSCYISDRNLAILRSRLLKRQKGKHISKQIDLHQRQARPLIRRSSKTINE